MPRYVLIKADTNDADYVTSIEVVTPELEETIKRVVTAIKGCKEFHNWPNNDYHENSPYSVYKDVLDEGDIDLFIEMVPFGEHGVHSIVEVKFFNTEFEEIL